jgi:alpha-mannosidase
MRKSSTGEGYIDMMYRKLTKVVVVTIVLGCSFGVNLIQVRAKSRSPLEEMTLHVVPQSHIDIAWWWRYDPETIHVVAKRTLEVAFDNMELYPDYTFTFLQVPAIQPLEKLYPELFYKLRYYVHNSKALGDRIRNPGASGRGRLEIAGGLWLEVDACVPCGESLVRQCLNGKRYFKNKFGIDVRTGWFEDAWTHPWTYPQILKKSGIDSYMFKRGQGGKGERMFWWQSPDGSRVFAYKPIAYKRLPSREDVERHLLETNKRYGVKDDIILVGVGNHGGGPTPGDVDNLKQALTELSVKAEFSTPTRFLNAVLSQKSNFPVVNYEISPTIRGAYTTVGEIKKCNRQSENRLFALEKFSCIAAVLRGLPYPRTDLNRAWEKVMLNQFHDTISGTDILPASDDALNLYREVLDMGRENLQSCLKAISSKINTEGIGIPVIVFNPLSWERTDLVETELECAKSIKSVRVIDVGGKDVPAQIINQKKGNEKHHLRFIFVAENVPSLGYKSYRAIPSSTTAKYSGSLKVSKQQMENEFFRVQIAPASGCLKSIFDKSNSREVLDKSAKGNLIQILEDLGDSEGFLAGDGKTWAGKSWDVYSNAQIELLQNGPVRALVQVKKKFELARFTQRIMLYPKLPKIDFDLVIDWCGKNKMVKVSFPTSISAQEATYEIPYGTIRRPSEGQEHVAQKWVDISKENYGVSLLNDGRYGYDVNDNVIRLSVLRSPTGPAYATDERGVHTLRYSLYPHKGNWQDANVMQRGYELNYPIIPIVEATHSGELPPTYSFVKIEPENLILTVIKKAEDSKDWILRFYETEGKKCTAKVVLAEPLAADAIHKIDLLENSLAEIRTDRTSFQMQVGAYSIESFRLIRDMN